MVHDNISVDEQDVAKLEKYKNQVKEGAHCYFGKAVLHRCRVHAGNLTQLCQHSNFLTMLAAILDRARVQISTLCAQKCPQQKPRRPSCRRS